MKKWVILFAKLLVRCSLTCLPLQLIEINVIQIHIAVLNIHGTLPDIPPIYPLLALWSTRRWNAHYFLEQGFLLFFCPRGWLAVQGIPAGFIMCISVKTFQRSKQKVTDKITHLELVISSLNCKLVCTPDNHSCKAFSTDMSIYFWWRPNIPLRPPKGWVLQE